MHIGCIMGIFTYWGKNMEYWWICPRVSWNVAGWQILVAGKIIELSLMPQGIKYWTVKKTYWANWITPSLKHGPCVWKVEHEVRGFRNPISSTTIYNCHSNSIPPTWTQTIFQEMVWSTYELPLDDFQKIWKTIYITLYNCQSCVFIVVQCGFNHHR